MTEPTWAPKGRSITERMRMYRELCPVCDAEYHMPEREFSRITTLCQNCRMWEYTICVNTETSPSGATIMTVSAYVEVGFVYVVGNPASGIKAMAAIAAPLMEVLRLREDPRDEPRKLLEKQAEGTLDMYDRWAFADWLMENGYPIIGEAIINASGATKRSD